jgi:hypothetical protein
VCSWTTVSGVGGGNMESFRDGVGALASYSGCLNQKTMLRFSYKRETTCGDGRDHGQHNGHRGRWLQRLPKHMPSGACA